MSANQTAAARRRSLRTRYTVVDVDRTVVRQPRPAPRRQGTRRAVILTAIREA